MPKKIVFFIPCFFFLFNSFGQSYNKGLLNTISTTNNIFQRFDSTYLEVLTKQEKKIWFLDSCVIIEIRTNLKSNEPTLKGRIIMESFPVAKYIYLDLKTMHAQDYFSFSDTTKPWKNYEITKSDTVSFWQFYKPKLVSDTAPGMSSLNDTAIDGNPLKRIKVLYKYYEYEKDYSIYYLDCNAPKTIFWLNRTVSNLFPGCLATRSEFFNFKNHLMGAFEFELLRNTLTSKEERIFAAWKYNSLHSGSPLLKHNRLDDAFFPVPEHENPRITILPLHSEE